MPTDTLDDLVIDETNFHEYFYDVKTNKPKPGQILAEYNAVAQFGDGELKRQIISLLSADFGAQSAVQLISKLGGATEKSAIQVVKEINADLISGKTVDEVAEKIYKYHFQQFYYTKKEYIPRDKHWSSMSLIDVRYENLEEVLEKIDK